MTTHSDILVRKIPWLGGAWQAAVGFAELNMADMSGSQQNIYCVSLRGSTTK